MSIKLFIQRALTIVAAYGFAALFLAIMRADQAVMSNGLFAMLPIALCIVLLVRIARRTNKVDA